jgi:hypothetical protein
VKDETRGVLIAEDQSESRAKRDFERLVAQVSRGEVKGMVLLDQDPGENPESKRGTNVMLASEHRMRRGAAYGAGVGFLVGLVPLLASTVIAAAIGGLLAKASELRVERGTAPRLHFAKRNPED